MFLLPCESPLPAARLLPSALGRAVSVCRAGELPGTGHRETPASAPGASALWARTGERDSEMPFNRSKTVLGFSAGQRGQSAAGAPRCPRPPLQGRGRGALIGNINPRDSQPHRKPVWGCPQRQGQVLGCEAESPRRARCGAGTTRGRHSPPCSRGNSAASAGWHLPALTAGTATGTAGALLINRLKRGEGIPDCPWTWVFPGRSCPDGHPKGLFSCPCST